MSKFDFEPDLSAPGANTRIFLHYRDASNYKATQFAVVSGRLTQDQFETMGRTLSDGEFMIPSQVGLPDIQSELTGSWSDDDHVFHTIVGIEMTEDAPTVEQSVEGMVAAWPKAEGEWDVVAALDRNAPPGYGGI